ncbi:thioredoxin family protein [Galbitalea sp. SE-J8]|uniref:thioredoxin family protein n=1 Tax=Galbitalea sp. SE-J8 TaxID=3054952 RepID=UPI00259CBDB4|nr:thioredoxin family protein [Galbitalea sp. SE-J8]MDM4764357.1 thioredoxin family protein [Galbitalea sp. SE-J8]
MQVTFYSSAFCEPCMATRLVLEEAARLVPAAVIEEVDVALALDRAEAARIRSTPTVVIDGPDGEVFRAEGAPTLSQLLVALAKAV